MSDAIAYLARAVAQGRGLERADLVLKGGRVFDLVTGALTKSDVAIANDRIVGTMGDYRGALRDRRRRQDRRPRLHRHASARRIVADHAARIRSLRARPRRHHGDLRPARNRQCARRRRPATISSTRRWRRRWTCACNCRAASRRRISRPPARASRSTISCPWRATRKCWVSPNS